MPNMSTNIAVPCCHKQPKNENERHGLVQQQVWYSKPRGRAKDAQGPVEGTGDCARRELGRLSKRRRVGREGRVGRPAPAAQGLSGDPRVVELADRALQRALRSREKRARSTGAYSPVVTQEGHFLAADDAWLPFLEEQGYAVVELSMDACSHERLLRLYREAVQLVNRDVVDASFPTRPRFETITAEHLPPYKTKGLQQFYGFASTPFADAARLEPEVRAVFAKIYGVEKGVVLFPRRVGNCPGEGQKRELAPPRPDAEPLLSKERGFVVGAGLPVPEATQRLPPARADGGVAPGEPIDARRAPNHGGLCSTRAPSWSMPDAQQPPRQQGRGQVGGEFSILQGETGGKV